MHVHWTWAAAGIITFVVALPTAILVVRAAPHQRQNRYLALVLLLIALYSLETLQYLGHDLRLGFAFKSGTNPPWLATPFAYLLFLSTVASPLTRPLRPRIVRGALLALTFLPFLVWPWIRDWFVIRDASWPGWANGQLYRPLELVIAGVLIFGLAVAIDNVRRTQPGSALRAQAVAYFAAFGARDLILSVSLLVYPTLAAQGTGSWLYPFSWLGDILFALFITYGALKTRLFDIDLKIKWTVNRGTLAAIFVAAFFVASEGAQVLFSEFAGNEFIGILAAGLLVFAIAPLQRFADRISDRAMPNVVDDDEYRTVRKRQVYQAALESALLDGRVSDRERDVLATLADELGLTARDVLELERTLTPHPA